MTSKNKKTEEEPKAEEAKVEEKKPVAKPEVKEEKPAKEKEKGEEEKSAEASGKPASEDKGVRRGGVFSAEEKEEIWIPKTKLGEKVYKEEIKSMKELFKLGVPIMEVGIVNKLLPGLKEEIIDVGRIQRVTDSGRRMRFRVVTVVGNEDGYIGIGSSKSKEVGPAIRNAINHAKLSISEVKRGCGSWECGCGRPHTVPLKVTAKAGSVKVSILPAPRGVGLRSGEVAKKILALAGIQDAWVKTEGHTRTGINFANAVFNALVNTNYVKMSDEKAKKLKVVSGSKED